ncbi:MAG: vanadium-dependent haloperoxidase [Pyrinomonadaceae bacterium]|nr:vanadium-dependent haloperoxidase [Pyrinomonadaceae bacterium]
MKDKTPLTKKKSEDENGAVTSRRGFLGKLGKAAVVGASIGAVGAKPFFDGKSSEITAQRTNTLTVTRAQKSYHWRSGIALQDYNATPQNMRYPENGDELLYPNRIAGYSKGLPHDATGEVIPSAYEMFLQAVRSGNPADFELIPMGGARKLISPQSGLAYDLQGGDAHSFVIPPAPAFASREIAAEIAENYWMALLRDIPFTNYPTNPIAAAAAADLTLFGNDLKAPKDQNGQVTPNLLFRGLTAGDRVGPLMSQFWYLPCFFGANEINQQIRTVRSIGDGGQDYMTDFSSWLAVQNGVNPAQSDIFDPVVRYMRNGRDLGQWVHVDVLFQGYFQAFLCIAGLGVAVDGGNPYNNSNNQTGFATFGGPHVATLLCEVATRALKAVWYQKWIVHRRFRPEVFAARIHRRLYGGADYPVHSEILNSIGSASRLGGYLPSGNALLPQAFPEGSPTHPAYGAGHATVAGACVTILKAWFNESAIIPNPVVPDVTGTTLAPYNGSENLTVGGELNKIASNVANGRNIAGVHWRSDATASLKLGEVVAISILRDQKTCYNEQFNGFSLTKFDGTTITV